jgi:hypothetical protein
MKQVKFILSFLLISISCGDRNISFDDIDFMSYNYIRNQSAVIGIEKEWAIECPIYLHIDSYYNTQLITEVSNQNKKTIKFIWNSRDPELIKIINGIIIKSRHLGPITSFMPPPETLYDGSYLLIRIINNHKYKIIKYPEEEQSSYTYGRLFRYATKLSNSFSYKNDYYFPQVENRKQQFIQFILKADSMDIP